MQDSAPKNDDARPEAEGTDRPAMMASLQKDVAAWRTGRGAPDMNAPELRSSVPASPRPNTQNTKPRIGTPNPKVQPAARAQGVAAEKKPFRMAYDGMSDADYAALRHSRGAR